MSSALPVDEKRKSAGGIDDNASVLAVCQKYRAIQSKKMKRMRKLAGLGNFCRVKFSNARDEEVSSPKEPPSCLYIFRQTSQTLASNEPIKILWKK
jgi:hypothetical protein